ncbi:MAG: hypothetical protein S4CHLAM6_15350 [Chlamydiae bacterium]|nr:hypothetical protein [Chlamydiota bacterium]
MKNNIYFKCVELLKKKAPLLKLLLQLAPQPLENSISSPSKNLNKQLSIVKKHQPSICFIYGTGYGHFYKKLKLWLCQDLNRRAIFFEESIDSLQNLFCTPVGFSMVQDDQVEIFYLKSPDFWTQNKKHLKSFLGMPFEIILDPSVKEGLDSFDEFKEKLSSLCLSQNSVFTEYLYASPLFYKNAFKNLYTLQDCFHSHKLKNQFSNIPAIICGAGPSINENLADLKKLNQKALIFAGGRAANVLNNSAIEPHFTLGIDPYPMHHETFSQNNFFSSPLIYRSRMNSDAVEKAHGALVYTPKAIGYPIIEWIESQLGIESPKLEEGLNVVNFSLQLAHYFGCNPIILIGCDLSYHQSHAYSKSIVLNQKLPNSGDIDSKDYSIHRGSFEKNIDGQKVYTLWKWKEEASWMAEFAQKNSDRIYLNATKAGLNIKGFENVDLNEILSNHLVHNYDLESIVFQSLINQKKSSINKHSIDMHIKDVYESLKRCLEQLTLISNTTKNHVLEKELLEDEVAFQKILLPLSDLFEMVEQEKKKVLREQKKASFLLSYAKKYCSLLDNA